MVTPTSLMISLMLLPRKISATMATMAISARIRAYSASPWPVSSPIGGVSVWTRAGTMRRGTGVSPWALGSAGPGPPHRGRDHRRAARVARPSAPHIRVRVGPRTALGKPPEADRRAPVTAATADLQRGCARPRLGAHVGDPPPAGARRRGLVDRRSRPVVLDPQPDERRRDRDPHPGVAARRVAHDVVER